MKVRRGTQLHPRGAPRARERASAAVEFALVLPLVLTMALAVVQVGLLVKDQLIVTETARAGARQAAVSTDDSSALAAAREAAVSLDPELMEITVTREDGTGTPATVEVVYHAPVVVPIVQWLFPSSIDLSSAATMRQETE
jgi:Flp pilus assembly protein TadG